LPDRAGTAIIVPVPVEENGLPTLRGEVAGQFDGSFRGARRRRLAHNNGAKTRPAARLGDEVARDRGNCRECRWC